MTKQKIRATSFRKGQDSIQSCYNLVSEIIQFSAKKLRCAKKEESMAHTQENKKAVNKHCPRGNPGVGLTRQSNIFKATLNIFNEPKEIIYKILKENMRTISQQIQSISKMIENKEEPNGKSGVEICN